MIDLNRGVSIRNHPSGFKVHMYKDDPGVYLDVNGQVLGDAVASAAGFDVEKDTRSRAKARRMAEARQRIEAEFADKELAVEELINAEGEGARFEVRNVPGGQFAIFTDEGKRVTSREMSKADAQALLRDMNGGSVQSRAKNQPVEEEEEDGPADETKTNPPPIAKTGPAPEKKPSMAQLKARYTELTGKKVRVGMSIADVTAAIAEAEANPKAKEPTMASRRKGRRTR